MELEERIRERAFQLWEEQGQPQDKELDNWLQAERECMAEPAIGLASEASVAALMGESQSEAASKEQPAPAESEKVLTPAGT